jgi:hypothetical protein
VTASLPKTAWGVAGFVMGSDIGKRRFPSRMTTNQG